MNVVRLKYLLLEISTMHSIKSCWCLKEYKILRSCSFQFSNIHELTLNSEFFISLLCKGDKICKKTERIYNARVSLVSVRLELA